MSGTTPSDSVLFEHAAVAAKSILKSVYRVQVGKALDPLDPDDFDVIVGRLAASLRRAVAGTERRALQRALAEMDVDWRAMPEVQRDRVIMAIRAAVEFPSHVVLPYVDRSFELRGDFIAGRSRRSMTARIDAGISASFSLRDERVAQWLRSSQSAFVTDEYGRRADRASELARQIVADGLDEGAGVDVIARDLRTRIGAMLAGRSDAYWSVIASSFAGRARTFGTISALQDAGIERWEVVATLDVNCCDGCRALDGTIFSVGASYERFTQASRLSEPEDIRDVMPWIRFGRDDEGNRTVFVRRSGEPDEVIATVTRSGVGTWDDRGDVTGRASPERMQELGCEMPPYHPRCACVVVAAE